MNLTCGLFDVTHTTPAGDDTVFDSVEMMVGLESDGGPGLGWAGDTQDTDEFLPEGKLDEQIQGACLRLTLHAWWDGPLRRMGSIACWRWCRAGSVGLTAQHVECMAGRHVECMARVTHEHLLPSIWQHTVHQL